jgi:ATP-dependent Lhr-like helicase
MSPSSSGSDCLSSFHPLVREWFRRRYGEPTAVQAAAWPAIASGKHVLALAPTGSGKTLTAFLGSISRIASGELPSEGLSVLYVSPLKALGEDVRRNLESPLGELSALFASRGVSWPGIRTATRSGDTSQADRRRMLRSPPAILATTPESLALMLDAPSSREMLKGVRFLVLDEIHALAGDKRGAMLACSVGRLALLAGEFQRVALSATARPVEVLAEFVGGRKLEYALSGQAIYSRREVAVIAPPAEKRIELSVEWPQAPTSSSAQPISRASDTAPRYAALVPAILEKMGGADGLLVFTDSRRRAERLAFLINERAGEGAAWAHHGSLSRETRAVIEERFKAGELGCVVATASLELGIDIGSVGEVLLAGTPDTVAQTLQRIGRSGHGVGEVSKGTLYPFHGMDLVLAAAAAKGVEERSVEETRPLSCPLDVLAQVILELALEGDSGEPRRVDELYDIVLSFPPFERLTRSLFDSALQMLAGKYSGTRLRELEPRLAIDRASGTVVAGKSARSLLYSSGGTIPDRGLYSMRVAGSKTRIGELDEEFVWERRVGEVFTLGAQAWRIVEITSEAVVVEGAPPDPDIVPFWKGEMRFRSPELCGRVLELLDKLSELDEEGGAAILERDYRFSADAADACSRFVRSQAAAGLGAPSLPTSKRIVLEEHEEAASRRDYRRLVLHTLRGRAINEPLSLALAACLEESSGLPVQRVVDEDLILLSVPVARGFEPARALEAALRSLAVEGRIERLARSSLEGSGLFGAQFRMNAARAMLLPKGLPGKRMPLWVSRMRARKLFEAVRGLPDFPVTVETWRSCLGDLFDLAGARALAQDVAEGRIELCAFSSRVPSPFAREALWQEIGENMYRTDELQARASSSVSDRVVEEALRSSRLRPRLDSDLVADFSSRLKRLVPGWVPDDMLSLAEWARERVLIPSSELPEIVACAPPSLAEAIALDPSCGGRLVRLRLPGATEEVLAHAERRDEIEVDPAAHIAEWLRREAAVPRDRITSLFGLHGEALEATLSELEEEGTAVLDLAVGDREGLVIDAQNLEILLRRGRRVARPEVIARPGEDLCRFLLEIQGVIAPSVATPGVAASGAVERALSSLSGAAIPAELWETEILPARVPDYRSADLDELLSAKPWQWFGSGRGLVAIAPASDLELFLSSKRGRSRRASSVLAANGGREDFWTMRERTGLSSKALALELWTEAWKGRAASDSFRDLREGIGSRFGADLPDIAGAEIPAEEAGHSLAFGAPRRIPRALRERWRTGSPLSGLWFALDLDDPEEEAEESDLLDEIGLDAARVRALSSRYGLLCRSILEREGEGLRWGDLFPAMRRLELTGELYYGRFFEGIEGPQFLDPAAFSAYQSLGDSSAIDSSLARALWINALDPAANALYALAARPSARPSLLPSRIASNRICIDRGRIVAVSTRSYRALALAVEPKDRRLGSILGLYVSARSRAVRPESRIVLETVNGRPASSSSFVEALRFAGFEPDREKMVLW